jgi:hypothetical protein
MKPPGVGLRILIDGGTTPQSEFATPPAAVSAPPLAPPARSLPTASPKESDAEVLTRMLAVLALVGADLGLLGWAAHHVFIHQRALNVVGIIACAGSVLLAALCGCAAARVAADRR